MVRSWYPRTLCHLMHCQSCTQACGGHTNYGVPFWVVAITLFFFFNWSSVLFLLGYPDYFKLNPLWVGNFHFQQILWCPFVPITHYSFNIRIASSIFFCWDMMRFQSIVLILFSSVYTWKLECRWSVVAMNKWITFHHCNSALGTFDSFFTLFHYFMQFFSYSCYSSSYSSSCH